MLDGKLVLLGLATFFASATISEACSSQFGSIFHHLGTCSSAFEKNKVVPDVIDVAPRSTAKITYDKTGVSANLGNTLTPTQVIDIPTVGYNADSSKLYSLLMIDPDAPSRASPTMREYRHWLVANIPGSNVASGETVSEYYGSGPPKGTGLHRYVFLIFEQKGKLDLTEQKQTTLSEEGRAQFSTRKFAQKNNLGNPIAGNLFQAEWDSSVTDD